MYLLLDAILGVSAHFIYVMAGPKHTMNLKSTCKHEMYDKNKI